MPDFSEIVGIEIKKGTYGGFAIYTRDYDDVVALGYAFTCEDDLLGWLKGALDAWKKAGEDE